MGPVFPFQAGIEPHWLDWYAKLRADWNKHGDVLHTLLLGNFLISTSNFFLRRTLYEQVGGFAELRYVHDYEYVLRLWLAGARIDCLWEQPLLNYRLHTTNTIREKPLAAIQENLQMLLSYLPALGPHLSVSRLHALRWHCRELFRYCNEEWAAELHHKLVAKEQELFPLIRDRDGWIAERDALISHQQQLIRDRERWIADRDGWIAERDQRIQYLQQQAQRQQERIAERESWLSDRDEMISKRDQWVADRDHWIAERDDWIRERDQLIRDLQQTQQQLLSSRSYRLGQGLLHPLRTLSGWARWLKWRPEHA
ncbi:MAG: hypothetical protein R3E89_01275 [Thiolinea sp.]